jgi:hypothetical protein
MKTSLILVIMLSLPAQAGWWSDMCARHLISDDPAPYAEVETDQLLEIYKVYSSGKQLDELLYRYRAGMMTHRQSMAFRNLFKKPQQP